MDGSPRPFVSSGLCRLDEPLVDPGTVGGIYTGDYYATELIFPQAMEITALPTSGTVQLLVGGQTIEMDMVNSFWANEYQIYLQFEPSENYDPIGYVKYTPGVVKFKTAQGREYEAFQVISSLPD